MKKILVSLLVIGTVLGLAGAGTWAIFSDTEQATGTFTTGTIDIAVDGQNPWSGTYPVTVDGGCGAGDEGTLLKPCYVGHIKFNVKNVGDNPAHVTLDLNNVKDSDVKMSEPECVAEHGEYANGACAGNTPVDDISNHIEVDLNGVWQRGKTLNSIQGQKLDLGILAPDTSRDVSISFHLAENAGNEYQGDRSTFDIVLNAEQLRNPPENDGEE